MHHGLLKSPRQASPVCKWRLKHVAFADCKMEKEAQKTKEADFDDQLKHAKNSFLGVKSLLCFFILASAWLVGFSSRLFAVVRFESIIHEFDPW